MRKVTAILLLSLLLAACGKETVEENNDLLEGILADPDSSTEEVMGSDEAAPIVPGPTYLPE